MRSPTPKTGLFRLVLLPDGSLSAFEYSSRGFRLVNLPVHVVEDVNAIPYLGQTVIEKYPELKAWNLPSRNKITSQLAHLCRLLPAFAPY